MSSNLRSWVSQSHTKSNQQARTERHLFRWGLAGSHRSSPPPPVYILLFSHFAVFLKKLSHRSKSPLMASVMWLKHSPKRLTDWEGAGLLALGLLPTLSILLLVSACLLLRKICPLSTTINKWINYAERHRHTHHHCHQHQEQKQPQHRQQHRHQLQPRQRTDWENNSGLKSKKRRRRMTLLKSRSINESSPLLIRKAPKADRAVGDDREPTPSPYRFYQ